MSKFLEIKWQGKIGQGVSTAASTLAEMLIPEGKYVQTFPEYLPEERFADVIFFNRISLSCLSQNNSRLMAIKPAYWD